jgi:uncharacterized protein YeaO (DUF488 family)
MRLFTKSIFKERESEEGKRISVMSRHTLDDGVTPDERIVEKSFDEWRKDLAAPGKLIGAYLREEISWEDFEKKYLEFLRSAEMKSKVEEFAKRCSEETVTLLCKEEKPDQCHRRLLAEELKRYQPELEIVYG